jgi:cell division septation protein DedD
MFLEQLSRAGYPVYLIPTTVNQVSLYRVRVGPFKSLQMAQHAAHRLQGEGHQAAWITR